MGHVKALEKTSCKYPVRRVEVKVDTVPTGNANYVQDNMSHFLDLDFIIDRVCHESKIVSTSSHFNFQIHVVE
jgi:hypothetical protein